MRIKVCGLKLPKNLLEVAGIEPDMIGLIFAKNSPRYVESSEPLLEVLSAVRVPKVGVFVNAGIEEIRSKIKDFGLTYVQLHGDESPEMVNALAQEVKVIKAFSVDENFNFELEDYSAAHQFLFDTKGEHRGGNGQKFAWSLLDRYVGNTPFLLSGGIGPADLEAVKSITHPCFVGVDLNSGFEVYPGVKKADELKEFKKGLDEVYG